MVTVVFLRLSESGLWTLLLLLLFGSTRTWWTRWTRRLKLEPGSGSGSGSGGETASEVELELESELGSESDLVTVWDIGCAES